MGDTLNIHQSWVSCIVKNISDALAKQHSHFVRMPTCPKVRENMEHYFWCHELHTHTYFKPRGRPRSQIWPGWHSINTQVMCDSRMQIVNIVARWYGSVHDSRIFNECFLKVQMEAGDYQGYLLGDLGYALCHYLMTPVQSSRCDAEKKKANSKYY